MRKFFLTSLSMLFALASFAQTTIETATQMKEGENKFTNEQTTDRFGAYWKYTSTADEIVIASGINGSNLSGYEYVDGSNEPTNLPTGNYTQIEGGNTTFNSVFPVPTGKTIYISAFGSETVGFNATIVKSPYVGRGTSENDWATIVPGAQQFFGNNSNSRTNPICFKFTPERDGVLVIRASDSGYVQDENGVSYSLNRNYTTYTNDAKVPVVGGKENKFKLYSYSAVYITSEMTYPEPGCYDMPFNAVEGANSVPKAAGTYWYVTATKDAGVINITSDEALEGGRVSIYSSTYNIDNDCPDAQSSTGSYNVNLAALANNTYYIKVEKAADTEAEQAFSYEFAPIKDGDTEDQPIYISDFSQDFTVPAGRTVYYAVSIPANVKKVLTVAATNEVKNEDTEVSVYQYSYSAVKGNSSVVTTVAGGYYGATYKVKWTSHENADITFKVSLDDLAQGDDISNPLEAQLGDNVLTGNGTKYYEFHAPQSGKLDVTVPEGVKLQFPKTTGYGYLSAIQNGNTYSLDVQDGELYNMELSNCVKDATFTLAYGKWAKGEAASNPIVVEGNEYVLGSQTNLWLKYTAKQDCKLTIDASAIPYSYSETVEYCPEGALDKLSGLYSSEDGVTSYITTFGASEGDSYLVHISFSAAHEGAAIKFAEVIPAMGETVSTPFVLNAGETISIPATNYYTPAWVKLNLKNGEPTIVASASIYGTLYATLDDAKADQNYTYANFSAVTEEDGSSHYDYAMELSEDGVYYLKVTYGEACTLSAVYDNEAGIGAAFNGDAKPVAYYSLDGVQLAAPQKGLNIVKLSDGRTVKMVVRK